ncbi:MAG TPA: S9 family peptidase [Bacteroidia bacterium]|jgi:dipeptidyl-peptidase-4|nr:S9 family peptidase [Bacteroidia bacterium]
MIKKIAFLFLAFVFVTAAAQKTQISVEDVWKNYTFFPAMFPGFNSMNDGVNYTQTEDNGDLAKYELSTGKQVAVLVKASELTPEGQSTPIKIQDYSFSDDETKLVIKNDYTGIYRRSGTANNYVFDFKTRKLKALSDKGKQMFATVAPVGNKVAFVRDNNIFIKDLDANTEIQITTDGENNKIKNGWADWVYEEEFSKAEAFFWNSNGTKIAFIRYDESKVKEFEMAMYKSLYPEEYKFKYPKAGEDNSIISVHIYDLASKKTTTVDIGKETNIYIPRIVWTNDANILSVQRMNRLQNKLELLFADANAGTTKVILTEDAKTYIDITDDLTFLKNNKGFIWSSEKDGFNHLYHYDFSGKLVNQVTKGNWDIMEFKGFDESTSTLYYISTEVSATDRDLYAVSVDGKKKTKLSKEKGTTGAEFSTSFKYYVSNYSNANTPPVYELHSSDGKLIKVLEDNKKLREKIAGYDMAKKEFFTFKTGEGVELNGWMMKPVNFDPSKKYPVFMFAYGGPGANEVNNQWELFDMPWHSVICGQGYVVACVDNRGTMGRGREFKHSTYLQLGKLECMDQIEVAKYLGTQSYIDKSRIGFMGWSFGGYLSSLLITKGADYFKANIAVAPVTNWRYYDNIYTERFMRTPQENAAGYDDNSPVNFVKSIKGKYLLIHGTADDNVHFQNSIEMNKALVANNIPFEFMAYPNKNHGISGGNTRLHLFNKMLEFIKRNL